MMDRVREEKSPIGSRRWATEYLRQLLFVGMTSRVRQVRIYPECGDPWLRSLLDRKPARLDTVAMANKTARVVWAVLAKNRPYAQPAA